MEKCLKPPTRQPWWPSCHGFLIYECVNLVVVLSATQSHLSPMMFGGTKPLCLKLLDWDLKLLIGTRICRIIDSTMSSQAHLHISSHIMTLTHYRSTIPANIILQFTGIDNWWLANLLRPPSRKKEVDAASQKFSPAAFKLVGKS